MTKTELSDSSAEDAKPQGFPIPANVFSLKVQQVQHYTEHLFHFRISRPATFRFRSGEFVMIGLPNALRPVFRAYSIASPSWDEELEFFSIKVEDGPLTQHLREIQPGDTILMRKKPTGTLVLDALLPGKRLYMISTGTGVAPFASLIRDPETYEKYQAVILTQTCREIAELTYGKTVVAEAKTDMLVGEMADKQLKHFTSTTREESQQMGRITNLISSGELFKNLGLPAFDPECDRVMICGSMAMFQDVKSLLEAAGLTEGSNSRPAEFVVEKAFVD